MKRRRRSSSSETPTSSGSDLSSGGKEAWQDEQMGGIEKIAGDICQELESYFARDVPRECDRFRLLLLFRERIQDKFQAKIETFDRTIRKLRKRDPDLYRYLMVSKEEEASFWKELSFCKKQVKFIDDLFQSEILKYDSPPATIAAIAKDLIDKSPSEFQQIATNLVKDRVRILLYVHDAEQKFLVQDWIRSFPAITEYSLNVDDLKLLQEDEKFGMFMETEIQKELEEYKCFLVNHGGNEKAREEYAKYIVDTHERSIKLFHKKPYDDENSLLNLAAQVVHGGYVVKDARKEILKLCH